MAPIEYIHKRLVEQRDSGKAVLLVSLELDEILDLSDRIAVISHGELVREYTVEGLTGNGWIELCKGTSVVHKRIELFETATLNKVMVSFTEYVDDPVIRKIAIHPAR